jgi:hypothetical protein
MRNGTSKKIKDVEIDGVVFRLAPLNMAQIEEIIEAEPTEEVSAGLRGGRDRIWGTIMASLTNAGETMTLQEVKSSLDLDGYLQLHRAVLEVSGLRTQAPPPEFSAAAASAVQ